MSIRQRLHRLENHYGRRGPCPVCQDQPGQVLVARRSAYPPDHGDRDPPAEPGDSPVGGGRCRRCGWQPQVVEIVEVLVSTRDQVAACRRAGIG